MFSSMPNTPRDEAHTTLLEPGLEKSSFEKFLKRDFVKIKVTLLLPRTKLQIRRTQQYALAHRL